MTSIHWLIGECQAVRDYKFERREEMTVHGYINETKEGFIRGFVMIIIRKDCVRLQSINVIVLIVGSMATFPNFHLLYLCA